MMDLALQAKLFRCHPRVFRRAGDSVNTGFQVFDERGVECWDGWFEMIDALARATDEEITCLAKRHVACEHWPRVVQIKEKFGTLRFRLIGPRSTTLHAWIQRVEDDSWRTCECCGQPSGLASSGPQPFCTGCMVIGASKPAISDMLRRSACPQAREQLATLLAQRAR